MEIKPKSRTKKQRKSLARFNYELAKVDKQEVQDVLNTLDLVWSNSLCCRGTYVRTNNKLSDHDSVVLRYIITNSMLTTLKRQTTSLPRYSSTTWRSFLQKSRRS